ncbi:hypothetical protein LSAT2_025689 [Lamellibrachia satsuma]|nr:hypothetical protein LSAT2_025689 [Lamellibrachia satsuma]
MMTSQPKQRGALWALSGVIFVAAERRTFVVEKAISSDVGYSGAVPSCTETPTTPNSSPTTTSDCSNSAVNRWNVMERLLRQAHKVCDDPKLYLLIFHPRHTSHRIVYHASKHHTTPDMRSAISSTVQQNFSNMPGCKGVVSHHKRLNCSWYHDRGTRGFSTRIKNCYFTCHEVFNNKHVRILQWHNIHGFCPISYEWFRDILHAL